jgi:neutral amino acid transport system permease protein
VAAGRWPTWLARILLAGVASLLVLAFPLAAFAQGETIGGTLAYQDEGERKPVAGVTIVVARDGEQVGTAVSEADGRWEVALPGPGTYDVRLDETSLPEGVTLTDPERVELNDVRVLGGQRRAVVFPLGEGAAGGVAVVRRVGALFVAGLKLGATIALAALGLSLVYAVTRLVNFAHAELVTLGAVAAYSFHVTAGMPLVVAAIPAIVLVAAFGWLQSRYIWQPLRRRMTPLLSLMVVSIGLSFALRSIIQLSFGGLPFAYVDFAGQPAVPILGVPVVPKHLATIAVSIVVLFVIAQFLQRSRTGTAMRAVADDVDLAASSGIDVDRVIRSTWVLAAGLAALGGIMFGLNESVSYDMGFRILLLLFAAVVLGGLGTSYGVMAGAFVVGIAVEMSTLWLPSELKVSVGLLILIAMLLFRPQGLLGSRARIG